MTIHDTVQMVPQDEPRSEADLGFMTEIDVEMPKQRGAKESVISDRIVSTRQSENDANTSAPRLDSSMLAIEKAEFKEVIRELISKEQSDALQLEERILEKLRKRNLSKGWDRPSGAKVAPLTVLKNAGMF